MTAPENVWLTTEVGDVLRADAIVGLHFRLPEPVDGPGGDLRPVEAELWATVTSIDHAVLVVTEPIDHLPRLLGELLAALGGAMSRSEPTIFVRAVPSSDQPGTGSVWAIESTPPDERWLAHLLG